MSVKSAAAAAALLVFTGVAFAEPVPWSYRAPSNESYFPVPVIRRERNSRPAIVKLSTSAPFAGMTQIRFCGRGLRGRLSASVRDSRVFLRC